MPAINFVPHHMDAVAAATKRQIVRPPRKRPIRPGDRLYLYTGMRIARCHLMMTMTCIDIYTLIVNCDGKGSLAGHLAMDVCPRRRSA